MPTRNGSGQVMLVALDWVHPSPPPITPPGSETVTDSSLTVTVTLSSSGSAESASMASWDSAIPSSPRSLSGVNPTPISAPAGAATASIQTSAAHAIKGVRSRRVIELM
jgi:hypothetical protein